MRAGGQWLPEMVDLAGGCDSAQEAGAPSMPLSWDQVCSTPGTIPLLEHRRTVPPHTAPACIQPALCNSWQHSLEEHTAIISAYFGLGVIDGCGMQVRAHAPEVLVLMQCGASAQGALACVSELAALPGWWGLPAVKSGCVFVVDHAPFLRPGPRVVRPSLQPLQRASAKHFWLLKAFL